MQARGSSRLSIVIPVYNEVRSIPSLVTICREVSSQELIEFVIVENGSSDNSLEILESELTNLEHFRVVPIENNRGVGHGISRGIQEADTEFIAWIPGNLKVHPQSCIEGYKLILASKHYPEVAAKALRTGRPLYDRTATAAVSTLWSMMTRKILWDTGAPPTIIPRSLVANRDLPSGYEIDVFVTRLIRKSGLHLLRFPVHYGERKHGESRWNSDFLAQIRLTLHISNFVRKAMMK